MNVTKARKIIINILYPLYVVAMFLFIGSTLAAFIFSDVLRKREFHKHFITACLDAFEEELRSMGEK